MRADRSRISLRSIRAANTRFVVIAGLDPAIHAAPRMGGEFGMGHRVEPGGDEWEDL